MLFLGELCGLGERLPLPTATGVGRGDPWVAPTETGVRCHNLAMPFDSTPNRESHRWPGFDYSAPCGYFVTVCVEDRRGLFGRIVAGATIAKGGVLSTREVDEGRAAVMELSPLGRAVEECWRAIPEHSPAVATLSHVVMPNHIHGIIRITPTPDWTAKQRALREADVERAKNWPVGATHASPPNHPQCSKRARHASPLQDRRHARH